MRRPLILLVMALMAATVVLVVSGVAYALTVQCDGPGDQDPVTGQCRGTPQDDEITGTEQAEIIFALGGFDFVFAGAGEDELHGGNLGDFLAGDEDNDTYFGGRGADELSDFGAEDPAESGNDVMNGGSGPDFIEGNEGNDILRGQRGDESEPGDPTDTSMFGDPGNDQLYGGPGDDGMEGEEGSDEHYGGEGNDFIDAADNESLATDAPDVVDCGGGTDTALVLPDDIVSENCEDVFNVFPFNSRITAASERADDAEQRRLKERFLEKRGD